jgi:hypothetical protein
MDFTKMVDVITPTAVVLAIAWLARTTITQFFSRDLEKAKADLKAEHDMNFAKEAHALKTAHEKYLEDIRYDRAKALDELRAAQQTALAKIQADTAERLARINAALIRTEKLEADLIKNRGEGYGEIWKLTGSLNLFGPMAEVNTEVLSARLKDWYFEHGWVLTQDSKRRYFLVQEVLSFGMLKSISFRRPADHELFGGNQRPVDVLRDCRSSLLGIESRGDQGEYKPDELERYVDSWKLAVISEGGLERLEERSWVMLQFVLSVFRSGIVEELGSRQMVGTEPLTQ